MPISPLEKTDTAAQPKESNDLYDLMVKNIQWSEAIYNQNKKIQTYMRWMTIMNTLRLVLIVIPIVLGLIYLPPLLGDAWQQYQSFVGFGEGTQFDASSIRDAFSQLSR